MHSSMKIVRPALLLILLSAGATEAAEPAIVFCDQMVLQRGVPVPIWGRAKPGERVTVNFAGQNKQATADARGLWRVKLDAMPASREPRTVTIKGAGDAVTLKDVLVGDVWLFSGDIVPLGYYHGRFLKRSRMGIYYDIRPFVKQDQSGGLPIIRTFEAPQRGRGRHTVRPQHRFNTDGKARWTAYDPAKWGGFHAIPYFFGREYFKRIKVPVGFLQIGLDDLESMTPPEGFAATAAMRDVAEVVGTWNPASPAVAPPI